MFIFGVIATTGVLVYGGKKIINSLTEKIVGNATSFMEKRISNLTTNISYG
jgi:hypothetical protein